MGSMCQKWFKKNKIFGAKTRVGNYNQSDT